MSERFKYSEARVAEAIGVERDEIRAFREMLKEGRDWKKIRGQVMLSEGSAQYVGKAYRVELDLEKLLSPVPAEEPAAEVPELNGQNGHRKKMRVIPPMPFNPRMVYAQDLDAQSAEGRSLVEVGHNENFCFNDEIEVEPHETQTGILQCVSEMPRDRRRPYHR